MGGKVGFKRALVWHVLRRPMLSIATLALLASCLSIAKKNKGDKSSRSRTDLWVRCPTLLQWLQLHSIVVEVGIVRHLCCQLQLSARTRHPSKEQAGGSSNWLYNAL